VTERERMRRSGVRESERERELVRVSERKRKLKRGGQLQKTSVEELLYFACFRM
jgi:hypothetical protein